jgi:4-hydroxythreonine-4-phosphate dehydrogenase
MEQRQPDDPNPQPTIPVADPIPDTRLRNRQVSETEPVLTQPDNQPATGRQDTPPRDNSNGEPSQGEARNERNQNDGDATARPRSEGDAASRQQRENRQSTNRNNRGDNNAQRGKNRNDGPRNDGQPTDGDAAARPQRDGQPKAGQRTNEPRLQGNPQPERDRNQTNRSPERESPLSEGTSRNAGNQPPQQVEYAGRENRLVIGISLGDYNGIGPEVILKALQYNRLQKLCTPVIYGSMRILNRYRNLLNLKDWNLNGAQTINQISHKLTNVITCWPDQNQDIQPGQVTPEAGQAALACLQRAVDDLKDGKLDALVTAPINKYNIQSEEFKFPGHTEYLAQEFGVEDNLMFMVSETLRVGVVTGHIPLGRVRQNVTRERITQKLTLMMQSLKQDFGIEKPRIAVLGLNPHAGEEGLLGNEENEVIKPVIAEWRNKGQLVFGPYPADGFFGTRSYKKFDAVLAMYHDQGLIPFKAIAFEEGVNFTAGMPAVRTSPDHGTAYDIAGKDLADETSMLQAIYTAIDVARNRKEYLELEAGALK